MGVAVSQVQLVGRVDPDSVRVPELSLTPLAQDVALAIQDDDSRIGQPIEQINSILGIAGNARDQAKGRLLAGVPTPSLVDRVGVLTASDDGLGLHDFSSWSI